MKSTEVKTNQRFGRHIEVNLLGDTKICSFNCGYCNLGATTVKLKDLKDASMFPVFEDVLFELKNLLASSSEPFESIVVSGMGEPTLFPNFADFTTELSLLVSSKSPTSKMILVTNGAHLDQRKMHEAAAKYTDVIIKLDVGTEEHFKTVNDPLIRGGIDRVITNARKIKNPILQAMLFEHEGAIFIKDRFDDFCELVGMLEPKMIQLQTVTESPANQNFKRISEDELEVIASLLRRRFQIEVKVY